MGHMSDQTPLPPQNPPPVSGQPAPGYYQPPTNTLAILALVFGFLFPIAGIICGHIARRQIKRTGEGGDGLALAGLILGYVLTGIIVLIVIAYAAFFVVIFSAIPWDTIPRE
jgi:hypothetical protein